MSQEEREPDYGGSPVHRAYQWMKRVATHKVTATIMSALALIVSRGAAYVSQQTSRATARLSVEVSQQATRSDMLNTSHQGYNELSKIFLDHPAMSYLYETNAQDYAVTKRDVLLMLTNKGARAELRLQEEATANFIFTTYEHTLEMYFVAAGSEDRNAAPRDPVSAKMLRVELDWYEKHLLHNPRLLWMWGEGGYAKDYSLYVKNAYRDHVLASKEELATIDKAGPFVEPTRTLKDSHNRPVN